MNLKSIKSSAEIKLSGITSEAEFRDGDLHALTLTDGDGNMLRVALDSYSMRAYVPAPLQKKTVHVVTGKMRVLGTEIREQFDEPYEANSRRNELEQSDVVEALAVKTEDVEIPF